MCDPGCIDFVAAVTCVSLLLDILPYLWSDSYHHMHGADMSYVYIFCCLFKMLFFEDASSQEACKQTGLLGSHYHIVLYCSAAVPFMDTV